MSCTFSSCPKSGSTVSELFKESVQKLSCTRQAASYRFIIYHADHLSLLALDQPLAPQECLCFGCIRISFGCLKVRLLTWLSPSFNLIKFFYISLTGDEVGSSSEMGLWTCTLCAKYKELRGESGAWFYRYLSFCWVVTLKNLGTCLSTGYSLAMENLDMYTREPVWPPFRASISTSKS